ncbi:MAG: tRNA (adenosine(37)-N6)-threonylcarbamoyltransferase complex transferase subunit TsaD, partial [Candidatus Neomarinimicrobiota bacterium]
QLWHVKGLRSYELLGESRDDAAGEAFDKGARILGLGYPGGPAIEKLAQGGRLDAVPFPRAFLNRETLEFSFSGLKTSLLYFMDGFRSGKHDLTENDIAASYQAAIIDILTAKLKQAVDQTGVATCVIAGGVAANTYLRGRVSRIFGGEKRVLFPELALCTDNAAMIAFLGEQYLQTGISSSIDFPVRPNFSLVTE